MSFIHTPNLIIEQHQNLKRVNINGKRYYQIPDGDTVEAFPSITTVLDANPEKKKSLAAWRARVGNDTANKIAAGAASRGTSLHLIGERYLGNDPDYMSGAMPTAQSMFLDLKPILDEHIGNIICQEASMFSRTLKIAGTADVIAEWDDELATVDLKNSIRPKKEEWITDYYLQVAAYSAMFYEMTGIAIKKGVIIIAVENSQPQVFECRVWSWLPKLLEQIKYHREVSG